MQTAIEFDTKPKTQKAKILEALQRAGMWGTTNVMLNKICYRYSARIEDLRKDGWIIDSVKEKGGLWRFVLHGRKAV